MGMEMKLQINIIAVSAINRMLVRHCKFMCECLCHTCTKLLDTLPII